MTTHVTTEIAPDGIATLTWNSPGAAPNTFNAESIAELTTAIDAVMADAAVRGIVITSAKADFIVGADLTMLQRAAALPREEFFGQVRRMQTLFRTIETCGKPVIAALNGTAVGGGFELALACHARIAADHPAVRVGLPEVSLGLLPGAGGTQRLPRLIGLREALGLITQGKTIPVRKALELGMLTEVANPQVLLERARELARTTDPVQPWDRKGYRIPGGEVQSPGGLETFVGGNAMITRETWGNYPAPRLAAYAIYHGAQLPIDQGLKIEARGFVELVMNPLTQNMVRTLFFSLGEARRLKARPKSPPTMIFGRIGVLGAGLMGHGIAHAAATSGIEVVLLDAELAAAERGKARVGEILAAAVAKGRLKESAAAAVLERIRPAADYRALTGCQLVVEAVFEKREIKAEVTSRAESVLAPDALFATNTSTLPISGLAEASIRPEQFIGLHFFSPVEKMQLVEVILGDRTSETTLALSLDFAKAIGKVP
ncbi:MAG: 3-hydroxyacyl-CoA dehydrogenase NAD-binding domain-containing protein, partial [Gemmatimonadales bacterium]